MAMKERDAVSMSGWLALLLGLGCLGGTIAPIAMIPRHMNDPALYIVAAGGVVITGNGFASGRLRRRPERGRRPPVFRPRNRNRETAGPRSGGPFPGQRKQPPP